MKNLKKYFNIKSGLYILLLITAYYLGDADLEKPVSKKIGLGTMTTSFEPKPSLKEGEYLVTKIIDGDTVHVKDNSGREEVLRFLAVDTLEKNSEDAREKCLANMESEFTKENLFNKKVSLETDPTQGERDKYGRLLVYISLASSTKTFNELLLESGNARVYRASRPAIMYKKYLELQTEAQNKSLGMWNTELCR